MKKKEEEGDVKLLLNKSSTRGNVSDLDIVLVLALPVSFLSLVIGILAGWVSREYMMNYREIPRPHPEMFDPNGNLVPDEIVAFRFENNYDDDSEEDDD